MITSAQIWPVHHALKISVEQLSLLDPASVRTIKHMETEDGVPNSSIPNIAAIKMVLETAGIEFAGSPDTAPGIRIHPRDQTEEGT